MKGIGKWIAPGVYKGDRMQYNRRAGRYGNQSYAHDAIVVGGNSERVRILLVDGPMAGEVKYVSPASLWQRESWANTPAGIAAIKAHGHPGDRSSVGV